MRRRKATARSEREIRGSGGKSGEGRQQAGHAFRAARLPGVAEIIDEPRLGRAVKEEGEREEERERVGDSKGALFSRLPQRGCSSALAVSSSVFDFALTCRHYAIRFGQPPVEKAPSWSWISITVVMATAIDSTGVRVNGEENGENERAGERTTADGRRGGQGCLA
ncbi:hypothetical protein X777_16877 [Ooceraea biroi]|uniref:Uncharacterized protein n=1 Tax=Ooceraea biroi TaxID=2015173 RepID=A0A026WSG6_OOCBI|nr:hypothetical protein X777_16877 [Ooceraea biroi]